MAKATRTLYKANIDNAKPREKDYLLSAGGGLYMRIKATGSKIWIFNYKNLVTSKRTNLTIGNYPYISIAQAKMKRDEYKTLLAQGVDPQKSKLDEEQEHRLKQESIFLSVAQKWKLKKSQEVEDLTLQKNWRRLESYVFPSLGSMPVTDILPNIVIQSLEPLSQQGKGDTLKRVIRLINEILNYAVNYGLLQSNPCHHVNAVFNFGKSQHNPTIRPEELPKLLYKIQNSKLMLFTRCLIKFQLLTMTRSMEASNAEWEEIDFSTALWTIPAGKMKTRKAHIIPLSSQALGILKIMKEFTGNMRYVFQSARSFNKPMNSQTVNKALIDLGYKDRLTGHGLRSIGSTYLNEYEPMIRPDVIEACLSHGIKDQVRKAYNRSDYLEQRKPIMQLWGDYIETCSPKS